MDTIVCFGEVLWDLLPDARFPGGAPFNVAYHLHRMGLRALPASAVGRDALGRELLELLAHWEIESSYVAVEAGLPTGTVQASLSPTGDASYVIAAPVAWDAIRVAPGLIREMQSARALVFGSLALRCEHNRRSLEVLLGAARPGALRVFDVNLRVPFDDLALVGRFARQAGLLKLNAAEAARLVGDGGETPGAEERHARALGSETGAGMVCVTAGARGAGLLKDGVWMWEPGRTVKVADTVGAGDAFLARLLCGLLARKETPAQTLAGACRLGEWVASRSGATPEYDAGTPVPARVSNE